ncbi:MAG: helix-turn-helix domain-containing protein, partial [Prevotellaceae bacterium]|nr:helix-turn-helix domain-containing protein [Prevotellaceae bacterium]
VKMKNIGEILRELRESKDLPLRTVAAFLDIDQAILSRIERGQRKASREQIVKLAEYFNVDENELLIAWLADQVTAVVADDKKIADKVLNIAKEQIKQ